jgi:hypothetical protein
VNIEMLKTQTILHKLRNWASVICHMWQRGKRGKDEQPLNCSVRSKTMRREFGAN